MNGTRPPSTHRASLAPSAVNVAAAILLVLHFIMATGSKLHESVTSDEIVHLTAGVSYWQNHDYRLHPENGILPQRWAAIPAVSTGAKFPTLQDNVEWRTSNVWMVGYQFFYETGEDHFPRLMAGRAMIALFSVATGLLVFWWSRRLFGNIGALVSLILYVFCPTLLANGALVTSDMCMAFFFLAATGAWWWHLHDSRARIWWLSAFTISLAFVAKFSAVLLIPMLILMAAVRAFAPMPLTLGGIVVSNRAGKFAAAALSAAGHSLVVALIIWACYGFRFSAFNSHSLPADQFIRSWAFVEEDGGTSIRLIHSLAAAHALPEGFLYGLAYVLKTVSTRSAFLNGDYSVSGWPLFFPWTFVLKTTLPVLLACPLIVFLAVRRWAQGGTQWHRDLYPLTPLIILFGVYWYSSLTSNLNIGHRHLLPIYPVLYIAAGALGLWAASGQIINRATLIILLGWHVGASVKVAPHYLAYFNALGGGPDNGWLHLVDSSLDWGQDLPGLKAWLDEHAGGEPVYLSYFGTGEPDYYGIKATRMPFLNLFNKTNPWYEPQGGFYCISATILQQVYSPLRGVWRLEWEKEYQTERAKEPLFREYWKNPTVRENLRKIGADLKFEATWRRYDQLRLVRLCHYLRARKPDANAGHSILIYHLSPAEIAGATTGPLSNLSTLIEQAEIKNP